MKPKKPRPPAHKRYVCRLPLAQAARLEALCEMYPLKTRSELLVDLIGLGLASMEHAWAGAASGWDGFHPDTRQPVYLLSGPFVDFHGLIHKHHLAMEQALAKEDPEASYPVDEYALGDED